jgi:hypothetical protein
VIVPSLRRPTPLRLEESAGRAGRALGRALDLNEGISPPPLSPGFSGGCPRWPRNMALLNDRTGELVPGRCRSTNLCAYCRRLYTIETLTMLLVDGLADPPTCWVVLTAREHLTRRDTHRHLEHLLRSARRRFGCVEWFVQCELQRRGALHLNLLVKGPAYDSHLPLRAVLAERWCRRVDAEHQAQWSGPVSDREGLARYLAKTLAHGLKQEQAPPLGWKGHRTSSTRAYFPDGALAARARAREALTRARADHRSEGQPLSIVEQQLWADSEVAYAESDTWTLCRFPSIEGPELSTGTGRHPKGP